MSADNEGRGFRVPRRIWSLWDMLGPHGYNVWALARALAHLEHQYASWAAVFEQEGWERIDPARAAVLILPLPKEMGASFGDIHLPMTFAQMQRIDRFRNTGCTLEELRAAYRDLCNRIEDELRATRFLVLSPRTEGLYEGKQIFGDLVETVLPNAIDDIEDAGKCIAVGQGTAAVFHLMRVMEAALKKLAALLGIPYAPSWESYLKQIATKISEKHKTKGVRWKRDEPFFRDLSGDLTMVKITWRNPTMHIVRRYSADEASEIFVAVRAFCQRLANHMTPRRAPLSLPSPD